MTGVPGYARLIGKLVQGDCVTKIISFRMKSFSIKAMLRALILSFSFVLSFTIVRKMVIKTLDLLCCGAFNIFEVLNRRLLSSYLRL